MRLILFDVDGTLLDCGGRTRGLLADALTATYGTVGALHNDGFAGKTDDQIVYDALLVAGLSERDIAESLPAAKRRYLAALGSGLNRAHVRLLPGVVETLERLEARAATKLGLLTGNWQLGAQCKLERAGLSGYFSFGAFGDGSRQRAALPPLALAAAAERFGRRFSVRDALIVGDTPNDIACARAHGISVLGIATGSASAAELEAAGADWVADDLPQAGYLEPMLDSVESGH